MAPSGSIVDPTDIRFLLQRWTRGAGEVCGRMWGGDLESTLLMYLILYIYRWVIIKCDGNYYVSFFGHTTMSVLNTKLKLKTMVWIERIQKNHTTTQMRKYKHTNPSAWGGEGCQSRHKCPRLLGGEAICQCQFTVGTNYCCGESNVIKHPASPQIVSLAKKSIKVGVITTLTRWSIKMARRLFEYHFIFPRQNFNHFAESFYKQTS